MLQPSAFQQAAAIAGYAIDELSMSTFSSLYDKGNAYADYLAKGFAFYVKQRGKRMDGGFKFQSGDKDYRAQLTKIKELAPDGLSIANYVTESANAVKQARELGLKTRFLGNNSWYKPMDEVAGAAADGSYFPNNIACDAGAAGAVLDQTLAAAGVRGQPPALTVPADRPAVTRFLQARGPRVEPRLASTVLPLVPLPQERTQLRGEDRSLYACSAPEKG